MEHWVDLKAHLARTYPIRASDDDWVCLGWAQQTVQAARARLGSLECVALAADICPAAGVSAHLALRLAARLLVGSLVEARGLLTVRDVVVLGRIDAKELDQRIAVLRDTALRLRPFLLSVPKAADCLGEY